MYHAEHILSKFQAHGNKTPLSKLTSTATTTKPEPGITVYTFRDGSELKSIGRGATRSFKIKLPNTKREQESKLYAISTGGDLRDISRDHGITLAKAKSLARSGIAGVEFVTLEIKATTTIYRKEAKQ